MGRVAFSSLPTTNQAYAPTRGIKSDSIKSVDRLDAMKVNVPAYARAYGDTLGNVMYRLGN